MNPPRIVRILASVRVPSGHGPDIDYEMVHAVVAPAANPATMHESVFLRLVAGDASRNDLVAEILARDLPAVHLEWTRFVSDVFRRRAQAGDPEAQAALEREQRTAAPRVSATPEAPPVIVSASGGRFGLRTKLSESARADAAPGVSMGPKKAPGPAPAPEAPAPDAPKKPILPDEIQVIGFTISTPPSAEGLLGTLQRQPRHLVVVAPSSVAKLAEDFIRDLRSGAVRGQPTTFTPIIVRRTSPKGPVPTKKLRAELAAGIARLLGNLNSALWILPE
jgi:hypothetical protein